jgi:16S rRNA U516 pseudouridylate synthase RsuA-like enzyme
MNKRIDYEQIAAKLDYATLNKKLEQLASSEPPKNRKTAVDLLEPLREGLAGLAT